jgi:hypothetical protein
MTGAQRTGQAMRHANLFTEHPRSVGETYLEHLSSAGGFGVRMTLGGVACLVHAILPFLFTGTGSRTMRRLNRELSARNEAADWERHPII